MQQILNSNVLVKMEEIKKFNGNLMFSEHHFVQTKQGWKKAFDIQIGDYVIGRYDEHIPIKNIVNCGKRPDAPIIGETNAKIAGTP